MDTSKKKSIEKFVKDTRKTYTAEQKILIVMERPTRRDFGSRIV